jgi:hypothetical protein
MGYLFDLLQHIVSAYINWIYLGMRSNGIGQALLVAFGAFKTRVFHIQEYWVRKNLYLTIICIKIKHKSGTDRT